MCQKGSNVYLVYVGEILKYQFLWIRNVLQEIHFILPDLLLLFDQHFPLLYPARLTC